MFSKVFSFIKNLFLGTEKEVIKGFHAAVEELEGVEKRVAALEKAVFPEAPPAQPVSAVAAPIVAAATEPPVTPATPETPAAQ